MRIQQVMRSPIHTCYVWDNANRAAQILWEQRCGALVVVDNQERLVGILTDRDLCMAAYTQGKRLAEIPVESVMSRKVYYCGPDNSLDVAEDIMRLHQVRRVPVVDERCHPVGIVSMGDILRHEYEGKREAPMHELARVVGEIVGSASTAPPPPVSNTNAQLFSLQRVDAS